MSIGENKVALGVPFGLLAGAAFGILKPSLGLVMGAGYGMIVGIIVGAIAQTVGDKSSDEPAVRSQSKIRR